MLPQSLYQHDYFNPTYALFITFDFILIIWLASAFLKGIESARDPAHRVTLMGPRYFFRDVFWRRFRRQSPYWFIFPSMLLGFVYYCDPRFRGMLLIEKRLYYSLNWPIELIWSALMTVVCYLLFAPRFRSVAALVLVSFLLSLGVELGVRKFYDFALPDEWRYFNSWSWYKEVFWEGLTRKMQGAPNTRHGILGVYPGYDVLTFYFLFPIIAACLLAWGWARRKGDAWFRLEDEA